MLTSVNHPLIQILQTFRDAAVSDREKGTYFEELCIKFLKNEASYKSLFEGVYSFSDWADLQHISMDRRDTGIDLVAVARGTGDVYAIQCKFYAADRKIDKKDLDSFFTASGKNPFSHRIVITTTDNWTEHANSALQDQQIPCNKIDLNDLMASQIDWSRYQPQLDVVLQDKKQLRTHQITAVKNVNQGLSQSERGKLIMACGTGKTFTSLKIAEQMAGAGKQVLFLVPSLALLGQTLREWTQESETPISSFAVCSDTDIGKKTKKAQDDEVVVLAHELSYPSTTDPKRLAHQVKIRAQDSSDSMTVIFSTYHSIATIAAAQSNFALPEFDLIICDEAHRTTGATFDDAEESAFVRVHDQGYIKGKKRLYMTATPRVYGEAAKGKASDDNIALCSMDDVTLFGEELHVINFSEAVHLGLLCDYKVIVLAVDENHINQRLQNLLKDENNQLMVDDAAKIVGCWKALSKQGTHEELVGDTDPMRRAVAFCQVIEDNSTRKSNSHKVSSKNIAAVFSEVVEAYKASEIENGFETEELPVSLRLNCEAEHIDGSMNASAKESKINWLKDEPAPDTCRILSNVRCLSEGVDVPALDAVLFLTPRNSQVDVVQSVGRVMRLSEGKKRGYVILPVVIPAKVSPEEALNDNKTYKVVWQVLQALRSHDDRFDAMINKVDLGAHDPSKMEVIAVTDTINKRTAPAKAGSGSGIGKPSTRKSKADEAENQGSLDFSPGELEKAIYAKVVQKCGNRFHWEDWANDIAKIANTHISRIQAILSNPENAQEITAFESFANELREDLNNSVTHEEVVEMLAQHLITKPVFDALFEGYSFTEHSPMSRAMQQVVDLLEQQNIDKETQTLQRFYDSVKFRASGIDNAQGKQKIVVELYDKFFRNAFPRMTERLGIVYTPVEVVDFIIHSVNDILKSEFGQTLGSENVHIIDPFTGTGTFITRLLQSGLIAPEQLAHKFKTEIHANEIVLLAYYIASINIESVYHDIVTTHKAATGDNSPTAYTPFEGICLTDTFAMHEQSDMVDALLEANSSRRKRQKKLDIRVIMGNPPYSSGQESANDNNANVAYPALDESIRRTYAAQSNATNKNALYDSYIRAIRWASDRIKDAGVIGFVTNAGWVDANTADGLRKCLAAEFSSLYVFHLRGNQRTSGEQSRKEGGKIFGSGSRAPIAISLLVKNPKANENGRIFFHDIGDYLSQKDKLEKITEFSSIAGIRSINGWQIITPDQHGDWINQRDDSFSEHISLGDKKDKNSVTVFENYSRGLETNRDAWCYNFSSLKLNSNLRKMIDFYNAEVRLYNKACAVAGRALDIDNLINADTTQISWNRSLKADLGRGKKYVFKESNNIYSLYRPYTKQWAYYASGINAYLNLMPRIFPNAQAVNRVICLTVTGTKEFSVIMADVLPDLHLIGDAQCFPLKLYEADTSDKPNATMPQGDLLGDLPQQELFEQNANPFTVKDGITDAGLAHFADFYAAQMPTGSKISKEDVFYYIYGLLHSDDYKNRYADNLTKELPRIPRVKQYADFLAFMQAGRALAELHVNYEAVDQYPVGFKGGQLAVDMMEDKDFYVTKMKFGTGSGVDDEGKAIKHDKTTIHYNSKITLTDIPLEAYGYVVNGKPAIEWVMERQGVSTHKDSGIVNDANDWAIETVGNARYPLELLQRVITVSIETMKIVNALPKLEI